MQRPLTGEPLPLDLLNTTWIENGSRRDALDDPGGLRAWLGEHGFDAADREPLVEAREAIRGVLEGPGEASRERLNRILARGCERVRLGAAGPERVLDVAPEWRVPWLAASGLVTLQVEHGDRIRRCANPECVLWFLDISRPGTRRWCSMAGCGNRHKARRHYERVHA